MTEEVLLAHGGVDRHGTEAIISTIEPTVLRASSPAVRAVLHWIGLIHLDLERRMKTDCGVAHARLTRTGPADRNVFTYEDCRSAGLVETDGFRLAAPPAHGYRRARNLP
jgi:hypothetical protein